MVATAHLHTPPPPLPASVPERVRDLVGAALAKDPADRPASAGDLGRDALALRQALQRAERTRPLRLGAPARPAPDRPALPVRAGTDRHRTAARLGGSLLGVVLLGLGTRACLAPGTATVPQIPRGSDVQVGTDAVRDAGLRVQQRLDPAPGARLGTVLGTDPAAGTRLETGSLVTLLVGSGPAPAEPPVEAPVEASAVPTPLPAAPAAVAPVPPGPAAPRRGPAAVAPAAPAPAPAPAPKGKPAGGKGGKDAKDKKGNAKGGKGGGA